MSFRTRRMRGQLLLLIAALACACHGELPTSPTDTRRNVTASTSLDSDGATLAPQHITLPVGGTATATARVKFPPALFEWTFSSSNNTVATARAYIPIGGSSTSIVIRGVAPGEASILYSVPSLGRAPGIANIGLVTVTDTRVDPPPPQQPRSKQCLVPSIIDPPRDQQIFAGQSATITFRHSGTSPYTYRWVAQEVSGPVTELPENDRKSIMTEPLYVTTSYWVTVRNSCGSVTSASAEVAVLPARTRSVRH